MAELQTETMASILVGIALIYPKQKVTINGNTIVVSDKSGKPTCRCKISNGSAEMYVNKNDKWELEVKGGPNNIAWHMWREMEHTPNKTLENAIHALCMYS